MLVLNKNMKIAIAGTGYVGLSNAVLLAQYNEVVGFKGTILYDTTKPDGTMRKWMDSSRLNQLGWQPSMLLRDGLVNAYQDFRASSAS